MNTNPAESKLAYFEARPHFDIEINNSILEVLYSPEFITTLNPKTQLLVVTPATIPKRTPKGFAALYEGEVEERLAAWPDNRLHRIIRMGDQFEDHLMQEGFDPNSKERTGMILMLTRDNKPLSTVSIILENTKYTEEKYIRKLDNGLYIVESAPEALEIENGTQVITQGWTYSVPHNRFKANTEDQLKQLKDVKAIFQAAGIVVRGLNVGLKRQGINAVLVTQQEGLMEKILGDEQSPDLSQLAIGEIIDSNDPKWFREVPDGMGKTLRINIFNTFFGKPSSQSKSIASIANQSKMKQLENIASITGGLGPVYLSRNPDDYANLR